MGRKKEKEMRAIVYLSVDGDVDTVDWKERKQLKYIQEYAKAHNIKIVKVMHKSILGASVINNHFNKMASLINQKEADAILISKMAVIAADLEDAYRKIGKVIRTGGHFITVDEGDLRLPLKMAM